MLTNVCEAWTSLLYHEMQALMYAMKAAEAAGIDAKGIKRRSAAAKRAAPRGDPSSSAAGGGDAGGSGGEGSGSDGGSASGSESTSADEGGASDVLPGDQALNLEQRLPSGDVEALVLAAKQAVRWARTRQPDRVVVCACGAVLCILQLCGGCCV